jgi:8-oxo-dGTP pyrophosphatase MutT (NUDIX family)
MIWKPNVTVAAVIEQEGKYLLVEEVQSAGPDSVFNQPAGHLELGESIIQGAIRETLEETGYTFVPQYLVGIYYWYFCAKDMTYLRFAFSGYISDYDPSRSLDAGIIRADWYSTDQIQKLLHRHRSPLVMQCIQDDLAGKRYPLELLTHFEK